MKTLSLRLFVLTALTMLAVPSPAAAQASAQSSASPDPSDMISEPAVSIPGVNHIRIVRLSQVTGHVRLDRNTGQKFETAFANLPIVAGERLETLDGLAEVEFEDNSSIRLTPHSLVEFPVLERNASGSTASGVKLISGTLYASMAGGKGGDQYTVAVGNRTLILPPSSHLRIDVPSAKSATLTVFKGDVTITYSASTVTVNKKKTLTFDPTTSAQPILAKSNSDPAAYDEWDKNSADYHKVRSSSAAFAGSPYSYGVNDLSYYGSFSNVGGCGSLWRPYLASAAWDPYGAGIWTYYPGAGYSWVSPYPWGWTPFHSGSWENCGGSGWGWRPQRGSWNGLGNQPAILHPISGPGKPRPVAPHPPAPGQPTLVPVNLKSLPVSRPAEGNAFAFRGDSAGLGVPRGAFNNLGKLSRTAEQHSFAPTHVGEAQMERTFATSSRIGPNGPVAGSNAQTPGGRVISNTSSQSGSNRSYQPSGGQQSGGSSNSGARPSAPSPSFSAPSSAGNSTATRNK